VSTGERTIDREDPERLFGGEAGRMLLVVSAGTMLIMTARLVLSPLLPSITADLGITTAQAGFALTVLWALVAVGQFPGGYLSDHLPGRTVLVASAVFSAAGMVVLLNASSFALFVAGAAVLGLGAGTYSTAGFVRVSELFERKRGQAVGVNAGSFDVGGVVAAGLAVAAVAVAGWRSAFLPVLGGLALVLVGYALWSPESHRVERVPIDLLAVARRILATARLRRVLLTFSLYNVVWQGTINFLPSYLQATKGVTPLFSSNAFAVLFLVGVVTKPLAGVAGDRFGEVRVAPWTLVAAAVGLGGLVLASSTVGVVASVVVFAVGLAAYFPVMTTYLLNSLADASRGGDLGASRSVLFGAGSVGPAYVGVVATAFDFDAAFAGFVAVLAVCIVLTFTLSSVRD
jgi:predicted MFS family arabinose efflux permease